MLAKNNFLVYITLPTKKSKPAKPQTIIFSNHANMTYNSVSYLLISLLFISLTTSISHEYRSQIYNFEIRLVPNKTHFTIDESITAIFVNNFGRSVYLVRSSGAPIRPLQKWDGKNWRRVDTSRRRGSFQQVVSYIELKPGETYEMRFPGNRLTELDNIEVSGIYRFSITIVPDKYFDERVTITSNEFRVGN